MGSSTGSFAGSAAATRRRRALAATRPSAREQTEIGARGDGFAPIGRTHQPLSEAIAAEIKQAILAGRYFPGDRLIEVDLAAELGVSRNPVREALRLLESAGFVEIVPRRGASVATLSVEEARQLFEVRAALEALAARLAAQRITEREVAELKAIIDRGMDAADRRELEVLPALNTEFHAALVSAARNDRLGALIETMRDKIQWIYARHLKQRAADSWSEHRELFDAVARRLPDEAAHLALRHISAAEAAFTRGEREIGKRAGS